MAGIVVVAHPELATQLARAAEHVVGTPQANVRAVNVPPDWPYEQALEAVRAAVAETAEETGEAVVVTDMFGGTPSNLALRCRIEARTEVIAGASLPMLVRLLTYRDRPLDELVSKAVAGAHEGVVVGSPHPGAAGEGSP